MLRFFASLMVAFFMVSCGGGSSDSTNTGSSYTTATLTHGGFDFSQNLKTEGADGSTIGWSANYIYAVGEDYGTAVWFRVDTLDSSGQKMYIYESTQTNLDDVTSVDSSKWINASDPYPSLKVGKIYVIKAADGYVKFKVSSINTTDWEADVEYKYSATTTF